MEIQYTIQMASKISGVGVHTIRAWEKRYKAIVPDRDHTGHRVYSKKDIEKLILLSELCFLGMSISKVANYDLAELKNHLLELGVTPEKLKKMEFNLAGESDQNQAQFDFKIPILKMALDSQKWDILFKELEILASHLSVLQFLDSVIFPLIDFAKNKNDQMILFQSLLKNIFFKILNKPVPLVTHQKTKTFFMTTEVCDNDFFSDLAKLKLLSMNVNLECIPGKLSPQHVAQLVLHLEIEQVITFSHASYQPQNQQNLKGAILEGIKNTILQPLAKELAKIEKVPTRKLKWIHLHILEDRFTPMDLGDIHSFSIDHLQCQLLTQFSHCDKNLNAGIV